MISAPGSSPRTTAVTGATGVLGSAVAAGLGPLVDRPVVRSPSRVPAALSGIEVRQASYGDHADTEEPVRGPAGDGRVAAVSRADVADVAVAVLRDPASHEGATLRLTGSEAFSVAEAARRMSAVLGRPLSSAEETVDEAYASRRVLSDQRWELDAWVSTYTAFASGALPEVTGDVERVAGHPARTLEEALGGSRRS